MKREWTIVVLALMTMFFGATSVGGYEDVTHQKLTPRAVQVADNNAQGVPPDLVALFVDSQGNIKDLGTQTIAGAGDPTWGEDYSRYDIYGPCPPVVNRKLDSNEPLNHFATGLLRADPAWIRFLTFWNDAITLWRQGNRPAAAFILGRAMHLVEDMAQPQHAMDEMHYPGGHWWLWWVRHPSFLENFTEAHVKGTGGSGFCGDSNADYNSLISRINPEPLPVVSPQDPQDAVMTMGGISAGIGESYKTTFTASWLNGIYGQVATNPLCGFVSHS